MFIEVEKGCGDWLFFLLLLVQKPVLVVGIQLYNNEHYGMGFNLMILTTLLNEFFPLKSSSCGIAELHQRVNSCLNFLCYSSEEFG